MNIATREAFLKPIELKVIEFDCRLGKIRMKELSGSDMSGLRDWMRPDGVKDDERSDNALLKLVTMSVIDEADNLVLTEADIDVLKEYPAELKNKLQTEASRLNGLASADQEVAGDLRGK